MELGKLKEIIENNWSKETCYTGCKDEWNFKKKELGQCAITALIVNDYYGGDILYCSHNHHYWNKLPNGLEVDFTRKQFPKNTIICIDEIKTREYILDSESAKKVQTKERYELLKKRIDNNILNK